jgi:hypothetical protein
VDLAAGSRWQSAVDTTEVVVVRPPTTAVELQCGGHPMVPHGTPSPTGMPIDDAHRSGTQLGKRYVDDEVGIEVLCTKAGEASLSVSGRPLTLKTAKPLPSSD